MEPRNFSRGPSKLLFGTAPVVAGAPRDVAENVDVPVDADHSTQILSANVSAIPTIAACSAIIAKEETKVETFYDELVSVLALLLYCCRTIPPFSEASTLRKVQ